MDDNRSYLATLPFKISPNQATKAFNWPKAALEWIRSAHAAPDTCELSEITSQANDVERGEILSVVVVDYSMPEMNGLDFCQAIADLPCKKILLTGLADAAVAVEAFNRRLIDCFIKKDDPLADAQLSESVEALKREFFIERTAGVNGSLPSDMYGFASEPAINDLLGAVMASEKFTEYYLSSEPPGFLLKRADGSRGLLVVLTDYCMQSHYEMARGDDAPQDLLDAIQARTVVPNYDSPSGMYEPGAPGHWMDHCRLAARVVGDTGEHYYWALFD